MPHPFRGVRRADRSPAYATFTVKADNPTGVGRIVGAWAVSEAGAEAGFRADPGDIGRLLAPNHRPPGVTGLETIGGDHHASATTGWFDGSDGAVVDTRNDSRLEVRTVARRRSRAVIVRGAGEPVRVGDVVHLCGVPD